MQRVFVYAEATLARNFLLTLFYCRIIKFFDAAALQAHQMVMMTALIELKNGFAAFEMMAHEQTGGLKLCQHTINRRQTDIHLLGEQMPIDILRRQMAIGAFLEDIENLESRKCRLEAGVFEVCRLAHCSGCPLEKLGRARLPRAMVVTVFIEFKAVAPMSMPLGAAKSGVWASS